MTTARWGCSKRQIAVDRWWQVVQSGDMAKDEEERGRRLSVTLDPDVHAGLKRLAFKDDRSMAKVVNRVLREHLGIQRSYEDEA